MHFYGSKHVAQILYMCSLILLAFFAACGQSFIIQSENNPMPPFNEPVPDPTENLAIDPDIPLAEGYFSNFLPIPREYPNNEIGALSTVNDYPIGGGSGYTIGPKKSDADFIISGADSLAKLRNTLSQASPGQIVWLEKDFLVTDGPIVIPDHVMLAGDRGQNSSGPKITCDYNPGGNDACIQLKSGSVVTGFRVFGTSSNPNQERETLCGVGRGKGYISNMEIKNFPDSSTIFLRGERGWIAYSDLGDQHYDAIYNGPDAELGYFFNLKIKWYWNAVAVGQNNTGAGQGFVLKRSLLIRGNRDYAGGADYGAETHETSNYHLSLERKVIVKHNTFQTTPDVDMTCISFYASGCGPWYDVKIGTANVSTKVTVTHNYFSRNFSELVDGGNIHNGWSLAYFIEGNGDVQDTLEYNSYADQR
ncbi:MAG TPA: hypothetical protein PKB05_04210 [Oligoflexia bacterium]|nr:hypothetical protein [Oligoflexia bacterium]